ncbi:uncharacterized protein MELLADRAFT_105781 [Melampsora larici-populina 98AG31]|uniref:Uncharacterized protein n=1 Tax=Melampsora larici-populina (strain 98AG31 / pathotype 3-4-7) TaxID=747676 RepID=F4RJB2_MELLP|nr:uncharacterized protein MELLADRAFT_105781 [Melampsora larici-populina 98AG31]EGG07283.1 hypothetical protein MELLADRAFT_105781 [Melampsora larici-populina 98AG31]
MPKKAKSSGSSTSPVTSPSTATELLSNMQKKVAAAPATFTLAGVPPSASRQTPKAPDSSIDNNETDNESHPFLSEIKKKSIKKIEFYRILLHFNPATKARVTGLKALLVAEFEKDLLPRLLPFISAAPPTPTDTEEDDFDPMASTTTRCMLKEVLQRRAPSVNIPSIAKIDGLRRLYKEHINPDLKLPEVTEFTKAPRALKEKALKGHTIEHLRFALQCKNPEVFIHTAGLDRPVCLASYIKFICEGMSCLPHAPDFVTETTLYCLHWTVLPVNLPCSIAYDNMVHKEMNKGYNSSRYEIIVSHCTCIIMDILPEIGPQT